MEENEDTGGKMVSGSAIIALMVGLVLGYLGGSYLSGSQQTAVGESEGSTMELAFVNHIQAELPEQDVFILSDSDSGQVMRLSVEEGSDPEMLAMDAYASSEAIEHDPFELGESPFGPFPAGEELGFTIGDWLSASGAGTYTVTDGMATLAASFENLVPNATYTIWCARIKFPPSPAGVDLPCGALDGSENVFTTDSDGSAGIDMSFPALRQSTANEMEVIALAYHSDGETYGFSPGEFGMASHVHIFAMMPAPEEN